MNKKLLRGLLLIPAAVLLMATTPLVDPAPVPIPSGLTEKEVHSTLRRTLIQREWHIDQDRPKEFVATLHVRVHSLTMRFVEDKGSVAMNYVASENLDYEVKKNGTRIIHRKYPEWCANLAGAISRDFDLALVEKSGS